MINNDSIVTAYDEHLTLVEWLQKIEKLLANDGLKSITLNDKGNATFSLTLTFNDDTTFTSSDMTLTSVNEALTVLTGDVNRIDRSVGLLNVKFHALDNSVEDIKNGTTHLFETITDRKGNNRFIEGNGDVETTVDGLTISYNKWSLSGSHIMFVLAGTFANGSELPENTDLVSFTLPTWILDKIIPVWGVNIEIKDFKAYAYDWSNQNIIVVLDKADDKIIIRATKPVTFSADRNFRVQFDLLIDSE